MEDHREQEYPLCAQCESIAKSDGLCGKHYMARYRAQEAVLVKEAEELLARYGDPTDWECDRCDGAGVRWFAEDGDIPEAKVLCAKHLEEVIQSLRMDLRRLGDRR